MGTWETVRLKDVCRIDKLQGIHKKLPYIGLEDIEGGTGRFLGTQTPKEVKSSTFKFSPHHLLYGRLRPYLNKVCIAPFEGHCSTEIFPILVNERVLERYLLHWLMMDSTVKAINETSTGARMPRAQMDAVMEFELPLPPVSEQKRIVAILDQAFKAIDAATANAEKNLANVKALFESYLDRTFSEGGNKWIATTLDRIAENCDNRRVPITRSERTSGPYPYYGASGIVDHVAGYIFEGEHLLISEDGANLLARSSPIAFSATGKYWVNNHAHILRFDCTATQRFVEYYLNGTKIDSYVTGAAQPKLTQQALNRIPIPIPQEVHEQESIVSRLDELQEEVARLTDTYTAKVAACDKFRTSVLHHAFVGKLAA